MYLIIIFSQRLKDTYSNEFYTLLIIGSIVTSIDIIIYNIITTSFKHPLLEVLYIEVLMFSVLIFFPDENKISELFLFKLTLNPLYLSAIELFKVILLLILQNKKLANIFIKMT